MPIGDCFVPGKTDGFAVQYDADSEYQRPDENKKSDRNRNHGESWRPKKTIVRIEERNLCRGDREREAYLATDDYLQISNN